MADSMEAAREMVAASERAGKLYMVSQSRRYDARLSAYKRLIKRMLRHTRGFAVQHALPGVEGSRRAQSFTSQPCVCSCLKSRSNRRGSMRGQW